MPQYNPRWLSCGLPFGLPLVIFRHPKTKRCSPHTDYIVEHYVIAELHCVVVEGFFN